MDALSIEEKENYSLITFQTETISFFNVTPLKDKMESLAQKGGGVVVMDFHQVRFVDSAGVGGILVSCMRLHRHGGKVLAVGVKDRVKKILDYVDRDEVINYFETIESALAFMDGN